MPQWEGPGLPMNLIAAIGGFYLQGVAQQLSTLYLSNGLDIVFCP